MKNSIGNDSQALVREAKCRRASSGAPPGGTCRRSDDAFVVRPDNAPDVELIMTPIALPADGERLLLARFHHSQSMRTPGNKGLPSTSQ